MNNKIVFVIPTYNESKNLPILLKQIGDLKLENWQAIIVDDNSPDGTSKLAEELSKKYPISLINRNRKMGLGSAYRDGFKAALKLKPDYIIQMDADLSHETKFIKPMLQKIDDCDMVIGSRYIGGGGTENWVWFRKFISSFTNLVTRTLLQSKIKDLTGGFKIFKADVLKFVIAQETSSVGYNFQIEVNILCERKNYRIKEVPIVFVERTYGKSKFDFKIIFESAWRIIFLAIKYAFKKS